MAAATPGSPGDKDVTRDTEDQQADTEDVDTSSKNIGGHDFEEEEDTNSEEQGEPIAVDPTLPFEAVSDTSSEDNVETVFIACLTFNIIELDIYLLLI